MALSQFLVSSIFQIARMLHLTRVFSIVGSTRRFSDCFKCMENVQTVRDTFGERTEEVLNNLKVEFTWVGGYMWVNNIDGHLMVSAKYLNDGDRLDVYLDLIHELVHVKQFMEGKELFDFHYSYTERPTELEAYGAAVKEARRLGLGDERICLYLKTEWMSNKDLRQLAKALNVSCNQ